MVMVMKLQAKVQLGARSKYLALHQQALPQTPVTELHVAVPQTVVQSAMPRLPCAMQLRCRTLQMLARWPTQT